ncbi:ATP-dependent DNA helicase [Natronospora cellulosivora (SeqCode)]
MEKLKEKEEIKISVREIVEFLLRSGDLKSSGFQGSSRALEGTKAHQKLQQSRDEENYTAEISLSYTYEYKNYIITISGRADGLIKDNSNLIIEEIKSTHLPLEAINENYNQIHWGQLTLYAFFYIKEYDLKEITTQLTYYQLETEKIKEFQRKYSLEELEAFFKELLDKYIYWLDYKSRWKEKRNKSLAKLEFPFASYRKGQRKLAVAVYKTIVDNKKIYVEAATGIGKTISTIFPAIKALGEDLLEKIFYLSAKTVTKQVAEDTIRGLINKGLEIKVLTLTAKEKICFLDECICDPDFCLYAKGHYDRLNFGIEEIFEKENIISREIISEYAQKHQLCPFEFSLDIANHVDFIICDYNYVFDPRVSLKRFFAEEARDYLFLIDEAHNLVGRAREMYSADIYLSQFIELRSSILKEKSNKLNKSIITYLDRIVSFLTGYALKIKDKHNNERYIIEEEVALEFYPILYGFINMVEEWLIENGDKNKHSKKEDLYQLLLETYFKVLAFLKIMDIYEENFISYYIEEDSIIEDSYKKGKEKNLFTNISDAEDQYISNDLKLKLFCIDPARNLKEVFKKSKAAVFFSATLTPLDYYQEVLAADDDYYLQLLSPFDSKNLCLLVADNISTKFNKRKEGYNLIVEYLYTIVSSKKGNYLVFFPSYAYMKAVYELFNEKYPEVNTLLQYRGMTEKERLDYLQSFDGNSNNYLAFAVTGGIFSEGIDLKGDKLIGTIVVGVAHPQITLERDLIKDYFQKKVSKGYDFAYLYPGVNKILQAAGRTIRSSTDEGVIFLIGERYENYQYSSLLPAYWHQIKKKVYSSKNLSILLKEFWRQHL